MSLHAIVDAHKNGFDENMYLDSKTRTKVEETGGANFLFVTKDGKVVTPKSDSILPSITRRSLIYVAKEYLGLEAEEREVYFDEVNRLRRVRLCGTAAVISPVGRLLTTAKRSASKRHERNGTDHQEAVRDTYRNPDGPHPAPEDAESH